jgi:uncharacterized cupin superfamily protein
VNTGDSDWTQAREHEGFRAQRAHLGRRAGARVTGLSLWEVEPGEKAYPYHWHVAEEEWVVITQGSPTLRTPEGERRLEQGEIVFFPRGEEGAHQLVNDTDAPLRFLSFSNVTDAEVCVYPDSGKVGAYAEHDREGVGKMFREADAVGYYEGEAS